MTTYTEYIHKSDLPEEEKKEAIQNFKRNSKHKTNYTGSSTYYKKK